MNKQLNVQDSPLLVVDQFWQLLQDCHKMGQISVSKCNANQKQLHVSKLESNIIRTAQFEHVTSFSLGCLLLGCDINLLPDHWSCFDMLGITVKYFLSISNYQNNNIFNPITHEQQALSNTGKHRKDEMPSCFHCTLASSTWQGDKMWKQTNNWAEYRSERNYFPLYKRGLANLHYSCSIIIAWHHWWYICLIQYTGKRSAAGLCLWNQDAEGTNLGHSLHDKRIAFSWHLWG